MNDTIKGTLFAFLAYASYAGSDAFIKASGENFTIFQIGFFITLFSSIPIILGRPATEKWGEALKISNPIQVHARGISALLGGICAIFAFTNLPLAEAYALIFLIPTFVTVLSVVFLKESVGWRRWSAVALGFAGILLIVRPGFQEIKIAHLAGIGCAFFGAISIATMRSISGKEKRITILSVIFLYNLTFYTIAMLLTLQSLDHSLLLVLAAGGVLSGFGHLSILRATSLAPANRVAPTQYSQIIWAVIIGIFFFNEYPDKFTYMGIAIVAASGILIFMREEAKGNKRVHINRFRNRL